MKTNLVILALTLLAIPRLTASEDPLNGYTGFTQSYFLDYSSGSFSPGNASDVQVKVGIAGSGDSFTTNTFNVDTGSRGLFASSTLLGTNFTTNSGSFAGEINLSSSGRVYTGYWTPTTLRFDVTDAFGAATNVTSYVPILDVLSMGCDSSTAFTTFSINSSAASNGVINLDGGGTVNYTNWTVTLTKGQSMSYASNPGLLGEVSNFGIGFDLNGKGTGPITNNANQIYNALINLAPMTNGSMVAGYIVQTNGIQLGLTQTNAGYAYTKLNPTGLTSSNSVPDWQTPTGQTVVNGVTNNPGSIVMDSGIGYAYLTAPGYTNGALSNPAISVQLMNSGGAVGYNITADTNNLLNPSFDYSKDPSNNVILSAPGSGIYSQNQPPYQGQYFNTGRNVFEAFNMLYDAQNGYMGLLTNSYGATDPNVFFTAGFYANPVPEPNAGSLAMLALLPVAAWMFRLRRRTAQTGRDS